MTQPQPGAAQPEPEPSDWRRLRRLCVWWLVAGIAGLGVAVAAFGQLRSGGYLFASAFGLGAVLRAVLPRQGAGGLAVRRPWLDVVSLLGLAVAVAVAFALVRL